MTRIGPTQIGARMARIRLFGISQDVVIFHYQLTVYSTGGSHDYTIPKSTTDRIGNGC